MRAPLGTPVSPPPPARSVASPLGPSEGSSHSEPLPEEVEYFDTERFIIAFDVGNSSTSITLTHLSWGARPLSPSSSALRTVLTYPFSTPALTPIPSRTPSLVAYDRDDLPRVFGAECITDEGRRLTRDEGWIVVKGWKEQVKPPVASVTPAAPKRPTEDAGKKLFKKLRPQHPAAGSALTPAGSSAATSSRSRPFAANSLWSLSSEGLLDAVEAKTEVHGPSLVTEPGAATMPGGVLSGIDGGSGALGDLGRSSLRASEREKDKPKALKVHHGPRLCSIYAAYLAWVVACARAWFSESTPGGDEVFVRCWENARFVFAMPADWTAAETDLISGAMEEARVLPSPFELGRLTFVKEPAAITYFARRHTKASEWLRDGESFALVDAAEQGVSIIGYTVSQASPRLKLRAYAPVSRLNAGAGAVTTAISDLITSRLARTKFKSPSILAHLLDEFRTRVLPRFSGILSETDEYRLRIVPEGGNGDSKIEKAVDSGARVRDGWLTLSAYDVESAFRPAVDAIVVRLSSILPRGEAKHILLSGGFAESPYLVARLRETFEPHGVQLLIPDIPAHTAVSEGALRFYLSETLSPRRTRFALGVQVAVDWATHWERGMHEREVFAGSGKRRLVLGKWGEVIPANEQDAPLASATTWRKTFNFRYRLAAQDPTFKTLLWRYDAAADKFLDGWMVGLDGKPRPAYTEVCEVTADLTSLVAVSEVQEEGERAWVQLQADLIIYVGDETLEAAVEWQVKDTTQRGPASTLPQDAF
ncbi:hypothetical protein JCM3770_003093 [Rhodotorula araucariae]